MTGEELLRCYANGERNFKRVRLNRANLNNAELPLIVLTEASLRGADLSEALLAGAEMIQTDLCKATLSQANLIGANLAWTNLRRANLAKTMLSGALLTGANFAQATLTQASLSGANLVGANFKGADLQNANLKGADLKTANLLNANLTGTDLEGADLTGAVMPTGERVVNMDDMPDRFLRLTRRSEVHHGIAHVFPNVEWLTAAEKPFESEDSSVCKVEEGAAESLAAEAEWLSALSQKTVSSQAPIRESEALSRKIAIAAGKPWQADRHLRQKLLRLYQRRCAITGYTVESVLEIASINVVEPSEGRDPSNALLLRADLRILFERHLLAIEPETMTVVMAPELQTTDYGQWVGQSIFLPEKTERLSKRAIADHLQKCGWWKDNTVAWPEGYVV